jgi:hypothetical protein
VVALRLFRGGPIIPHSIEASEFGAKAELEQMEDQHISSEPANVAGRWHANHVLCNGGYKCGQVMYPRTVDFDEKARSPCACRLAEEFSNRHRAGRRGADTKRD